MTATEPTVAEAVREWPVEKKQAVLLALLREAIEINGGRGLIPVEDESGALFGYYVPPLAAQEEYKKDAPKLTPEQRGDLQRRAEKPGRLFTLEETLEWFQEADAAGSPEGQLSATG